MAALIAELDVRQAAAGDREAFARLLEATRTTVCSIALAVVRDVEASEDVAQDVYVHAWRGLPGLRNADSFLPWLRQLARNRAHAFLRRDQPARRTNLNEELQATLRDPRVTAEEGLLDAEQRRLLREALDALSADAREVLILYYREEQSVRQVATLLEISESAVKKRLERARDALRETLLRGASEVVAATKPGAAFSFTVLALLPPLSPATKVAGQSALLAAGASKGLAALGGSFLSALFGVGGLLVGYANLLREAEDEAERRAILRLSFVGVLLMLVLSFSLKPLTSIFPRTQAVLVWYAVLIATMALQFFVIVPRITARRLARERDRDPSAAARQRRAWRFGYLWFTLGATLGGLGVLAAILHA